MMELSRTLSRKAAPARSTLAGPRRSLLASRSRGRQRSGSSWWSFPDSAHGQAMTVLSGSMTPGIPVGRSCSSDLSIRPPSRSATSRPTRRAGQGDYITHRIVSIDRTGTDTATFTFKGDANRGPTSTRSSTGRFAARSGSTCPTSARSVTDLKARAA